MRGGLWERKGCLEPSTVVSDHALVMAEAAAAGLGQVPVGVRWAQCFTSYQQERPLGLLAQPPPS